MRKLYFHLLAFEANKAGSLAPTEVNAGPYDDLVDDSFWDLVGDAVSQRVGRMAVRERPARVSVAATAGSGNGRPHGADRGDRRPD